MEVNFQDGGEPDILLLNESPVTPMILKGHLRNEENVKVVVVLADDDNPNSNTVTSFP